MLSGGAPHNWGPGTWYSHKALSFSSFIYNFIKIAGEDIFRVRLKQFESLKIKDFIYILRIIFVFMEFKNFIWC